MNDGDNEWETQTDIHAPIADYSAQHPPAEMTGVGTCE